MQRKDVLQTLANFQQVKGKEYQIRRIGIFGSAARNQLVETSDVDVVVELLEPDLLVLVGIKQDLEALLHRQVDIVRYREKMNAFLKQRIEDEAVYV
ncbi:MAG: nucleotidyltransferase domain-containing protein [Anaerolineales bacterium]|nr:nucleotidyltransferase domain-containing protein [Anaerolineales bacterium]